MFRLDKLNCDIYIDNSVVHEIEKLLFERYTLKLSMDTNDETKSKRNNTIEELVDEISERIGKLIKNNIVAIHGTNGYEIF